MRTPVNKNGQGISASSFKPTDQERKFIHMVQNSYRDSYVQLNKRRRIFNNRNVFEAEAEAEDDFNNFIPSPSLDPEMSWRAQVSRPVTRNKVMSMHGHLMSRVIVPSISAQNDRDEEDLAAAETMRTLLEYITYNSKYVRRYMNSVFASLVSPASILKVNYNDIQRKVRYTLPNGEKLETTIRDTDRSGSQIRHVGVKDFYPGNIWEPDVQLQPFNIDREFITFEDAKSEFGEHRNFNYVHKGTQTLIPDNDATIFVDYKDPLLQGEFIEKITYHNKSEDLMVTFLNGVPVTDIDNPNPRTDKKYPFVVTGGEPLTTTPFFYYKSIASKLGPEKELVDTLYNMILDGTFLELMPPMSYYGDEELEGASSIHIPGAMVYMGTNKDSAFEKIGGESNIRLGAQIMENVERSLSESSQSPLASGQVIPGERTAEEARVLQQNAQLQLGYSMRMLTFMAEDVGDLLVGDILQHMTVGEIGELTDPNARLQYTKYFLPADRDAGRDQSKSVVFDPSIDDIENEEELLERQFEILEKEGLQSSTRMYMASPQMMRRNKYLTRVTAADLQEENPAVKKALRLEAYDRMIQNPVLDQREVTKEFLLGTYAPTDKERFMQAKENPAMAAVANPSEPTQPSGNSVVGRLTQRERNVEEV